MRSKAGAPRAALHGTKHPTTDVTLIKNVYDVSCAFSTPVWLPVGTKMHTHFRMHTCFGLCATATLMRYLTPKDECFVLQSTTAAALLLYTVKCSSR